MSFSSFFLVFFFQCNDAPLLMSPVPVKWLSGLKTIIPLVIQFNISVTINSLFVATKQRGARFMEIGAIRSLNALVS